MLSIFLGEMDKNVIHDVDAYFDNQFKYEWLEDDLVKELILDVDKSVVESPECIMSPVLRQIPPTRLSGGVKALILMKYLQSDNIIVNASACGDNCAKWILTLADQFEEDFVINLNHIMDFGGDSFKIKILNNGIIVNNMKEFIDIATEYI